MFPSTPFSGKAIGATAASFLKFPAGTRLEGMAGAAVAGAEGAEALFYNPAGLARRDDKFASDLSLGGGRLIAGAHSGSAAYSRSLGKLGVAAAGLVYYSHGSQTAFDGRGDEVGSFTPSDGALSLAFARRRKSFLYGAGAKIIRTSLHETAGVTAALDMGFQMLNVVVAGDGPMDIGVSISNLGPPLSVGGVASPLPLALRSGFLWHLSPYVRAAMDANFPVDHDPYVSIGGEGSYSWGKVRPIRTALRLGYNQRNMRGVDGLAGMSAGAGVDIGGIRFDYAWVPYGDLGQVDRFSLGVRF